MKFCCVKNKCEKNLLIFSGKISRGENKKSFFKLIECIYEARMKSNGYNKTKEIFNWKIIFLLEIEFLLI